MSDGASGPTRLSDSVPARLIQSTGNLYWSSNAGIQSSIYRASKSSQPGEEIVLHNEIDPTNETYFGALTFAKVDDEFVGIFVANYSYASEIKLVPLAGGASGAAGVLSYPPAAIGPGDLVTDGSFLCWADGEGIRSMPIGGGPVTTLVAGTGFQHLSVLGGILYYIDGDGNAIFSVPTGGGTPSNVVGEQASPITALYALEVQPRAALAERPGPPIVQDVVLIWGRADGAVYGMLLGETTTYQAPAADTTVLSVYSTGPRVLWSTQYVGQEGTQYQVQMAHGGVTTTLSSENTVQLGGDLLSDEVAAYWTDAYVEKYTF